MVVVMCIMLSCVLCMCVYVIASRGSKRGAEANKQFTWLSSHVHQTVDACACLHMIRRLSVMAGQCSPGMS